MMTYTAQNPAYNTTQADAEAFLRKLAALGIMSGRIHANGQSAGEEAEYVEPSDIGLEPAGLYNLLARINGDWHNIAMLKKVFGTGSVEEFKRVCADCRIEPNNALLNIPGAMAAIAALIATA